MTDEKNWNAFGRMRRPPDPERVREFAATARKLQRERESSVEIVDRLLRETPADQWPSLASDESLRTSGALERLSKEVASRLERNPREALTIAMLATDLADRVPADAYPPVVVAQVRAHAWKDRGQALCYLSRYDEALESLARAEALVDAFGTLAHDRAVVRFVRATTLRNSGKYDESREIMNECRVVFHDHGDSRLELYCGISEGLVLWRHGDVRGARELFEELLKVAQAVEDREAMARLHNNIANCCIELYELDEADEHITRAKQLFSDLGWGAEKLRVQTLGGRVLLRRGDIDGAINILRRVRRALLQNQLIEEAGICGLEAVEAMLQQHAADDASALASEIVQQFTDAGLNRRAVMAVAYLREAIEARTASVHTAESVRAYIGELRKNPELEFEAIN